mmetsp:Transcript_21116/g.24309  ORF Transcript_21116/g.24309 Transcript_21116/m.24309 type:complete len:1147 (+) Transcript_21116:303-3743(+)
MPFLFHACYSLGKSSKSLQTAFSLLRSNSNQLRWTKSSLTSSNNRTKHRVLFSTRSKKDHLSKKTRVENEIIPSIQQYQNPLQLSNRKQTSNNTTFEPNHATKAMLESDYCKLSLLALHKHDAEEPTVKALTQQAKLTEAQWQQIEQKTRDLVTQVRQNRSNKVGIDLDAFMVEYDLSNSEGISLMCLAEALLRIPDNFTADKLIRDKICTADWELHLGRSTSIFVNTATWSLMLTGKVLHFNSETDEVYKKAWRSFVDRSSESVVRTAVRTAMQILGKEFVMEETIVSALKKAQKKEAKGYRYSYDMLGEAAKTTPGAELYYQEYLSAIHAIGKAHKDNTLEDGAGISIKLSALHPRYELTQHKRIMTEMVPKVLELARKAKYYNINLTIDAEEADRLELSLVVFTKLAHHADLKGWNGLGLAVQAYQKRAPHVLQYLIDLAKASERRFMVRLVKGAYWDSEIKHAQELGYTEYPVYTRKAHTDVCYMACTKILLDHPSAFYAQFATHNALSLATVLTLAGDRNDYEFQCLHGMGDILYDEIVQQGKSCRIYAPIGSYKLLLAYLVRRLLENGANSSFVNRLVDANIPVDQLTRDPIAIAKRHDCQQHLQIPSPRHIFGDARMNAAGIDLTNPQTLCALLDELSMYSQETWIAMPLLSKPVEVKGQGYPVTNPANNSEVVGQLYHATQADATSAIDAAIMAFPSWEATPPIERAQKLDRMGDLLEENMARFMTLATKEAGKSLSNSISEVREAIDFCRYYAEQTRSLFIEPKILPGPTGERNSVHLRGRGVFVCISPWNFPLAIFLGEVTAALAAGNTVVAKPAPQTSLIATAAVELLYQAGFPRDVVQLVPGSGSLGGTLIEDPRIAGVIFTGSTEVAKIIQRAQAEKKGAITTFIAETGGQNAMIVDSSALPEQVVTDVINSAFDSAGQRCSALRVLYLQDDIAGEVINMLIGAMDELQIGDPMIVDTDIGPVIDQDAKSVLVKHIDQLKKAGKLLHEATLDDSSKAGTFVAPTLFELDHVDELEREVFGPVLHIIRFEAQKLDQVINEINSSGYGLTFGIHSRIQETVDYVTQNIRAGNLYVNRNTVGAVVGVQPFGGEGLSGTGPKAGGPYYLPRLATERVISVDTTASGGNTSLMTLAQD